MPALLAAVVFDLVLVPFASGVHDRAGHVHTRLEALMVGHLARAVINIFAAELLSDFKTDPGAQQAGLHVLSVVNASRQLCCRCCQLGFRDVQLLELLHTTTPLLGRSANLPGGIGSRRVSQQHLRKLHALRMLLPRCFCLHRGSLNSLSFRFHLKQLRVVVLVTVNIHGVRD
jgi:hypothetical protein